jgi:hypothetical protein
MADYFTISYKEIGPVITQNDTTTDRITIIGTALDGPTSTPTRITTQSEAEAIFGPLVFNSIYKNPANNLDDGTYSGNELVRAYVEASRTGANNIWLCRVAGRKASGSFLSASTGMIFTAFYPGVSYNSITVTVTGSSTSGSVIISAPERYGGTIQYSFTSSKTVSQLMRDINSNTLNKAAVASLNLGTNPYISATVWALSTTGTITLSGGSYGINQAGDLDNSTTKWGIYTELTREDGVFDSIVDFNTDLIVLAGLYADDEVISGNTTTSFATALSDHCKNASVYHPTHGVIGLRPLGLSITDTEAITQHIKNYWYNSDAGYISVNDHWLKFGYFRWNGFVENLGVQDQFVDNGSLITVFAGPDVRMNIPALGLYQTSAAAVYAGFVSNLPSQIAATKQLLPGTLGLAFTIREKQIKNIVDGVDADETTRTPGHGAMVVLRNESITSRPEVVYDVTFAYDRNRAYANLQAQRVVQEALKRTKMELTPYLGQAFTTQTQMAIESRLRRLFESMVQEGKLHAAGEGQAYQFIVNANPLQIANNELSVELILWPALQIRRIRIATTVRRG